MIFTGLHVVLAEARKCLRIAWYYKFDMVMQVVTLSFIFLLLVFFLGKGSVNSADLSTAVLGYLVWLYAINMINAVGIELIGEAQAGTLEQMYMSVSPPELAMVGRAVAALVTTTIMVGILDIALVLFLHTPIPVSWTGLAMLLITLAGLFGFALIIGGATLRFKHVGGLANLMINVIFFTNGTLLSIDHFPGWLTAIANSLPTTQGVTLLREAVLHGRSLPTMWGDGSLPRLLGNSAVYLVIGWLVFEAGARGARRRGSLGQY
ncbi:MAG: type transporter [Actinomycetia bacterium]|nr:type transporter [Actinomycetes bacterium]